MLAHARLEDADTDSWQCPGPDAPASVSNGALLRGLGFRVKEHHPLWGFKVEGLEL